MFAFLNVKLLSPDIKSNADSPGALVDTGKYTMSISSNENISMQITYTSSLEIHTATNTITYTNTCPHGFNVMMSAAQDNTSLTRAGVDDYTKVIPTISSGTVLVDNTWGYSIDNGITYNAIPSALDPDVVLDTTSANAEVATFDVLYGVRIDDSIPSGSYIADIIYTISAKPECLAYEISWNLGDGGISSGGNYPSSINYGETIDLSTFNPTRNGYNFIGWSNGEDNYTGSETDVNINLSDKASVEMTALWEPIDYQIQYDLNGGSFSSSSVRSSYNIETATFTLSTPTKRGFTFTGWSGTEISGSSTSVKVTKGSTGDRSYIANWQENPAMQNFSCYSITSNNGRIVLKDSRDGEYYDIIRAKTGKCWMMQNLRISNKTISSTDSNLPDGMSFTIPASDISSFEYQTIKNAMYLDPTHGGYYTFYTATAGWESPSITSGDATRDICPKGWRLPTGGEDGEFAGILSSYGSAHSARTIMGFGTSGYIQFSFNPSTGEYASGPTLFGVGTYAAYVTSTVYSSQQVYVAFGWYTKESGASIKSYKLDAARLAYRETYRGGGGDSIRCVSKTP